MTAFVRTQQRLIRVDAITSVDLSQLEQLRVVIHHRDGVDCAEGPDAIDAVYILRPSALEGRRFRYVRHSWAIHNLFAHPMMQVLAWCRQVKLGLWLHDITVPRPRGLLVDGHQHRFRPRHRQSTSTSTSKRTKLTRGCFLDSVSAVQIHLRHFADLSRNQSGAV